MDGLKLFIAKVFRDIPETWDASKQTLSLVEKYKTKYNQILVKQIPFLYGTLKQDEQDWVIRKVEEFRQERGPSASRDSRQFAEAFASQVMETAKSNRFNNDPILKEKMLVNFEATKRNLFPYNPQTGQVLRIKKFFGISQDQNVYLVTDERETTNWIMKWEEYVEENDEAKAYRQIEQLGAKVPARLDGFKFLDFGVLIMEFLYPMDITDRPSAIAKDLLAQLKVIHTIGCYFDLKTDNIRKRNSNPPVYFIIDMNLSTEKRPDGTFVRRHWTPLYRSQLFPQDMGAYQRSSYLNDLIELKYVLHQMIYQRAYETKYWPFDESLSSQYVRVKTLIFGLEKKDFFADPDRMNKDLISTTARGWKCMKLMLEFPPYVSWAITNEFHEVIENLNHGPPPPGIHDFLLEKIDLRQEKLFFRETEAKLTIQCSICTTSAAIGKCSECYSQITFVCSTLCAARHKCI